MWARVEWARILGRVLWDDRVSVVCPSHQQTTPFVRQPPEIAEKRLGCRGYLTKVGISAPTIVEKGIVHGLPDGYDAACCT